MSRRKKNKLTRHQQAAGGSNNFSITQHRVSIGPIPDPETLTHYEQLLPGSAERIITRWEEQGKHRMALEKKVVNSGVMLAYFGLASAFILGLVGVAGGIWLIHEGKDGYGLAAIITSLGALGGVYIWGKSKQGEELRNKRAPFGR